MATPLTSKRRASTIAIVLFFIGFATIASFNTWWPAIMLVIGVPLAIRQYLLGRIYDMYISLFVFIGVYITIQFDISWQILLPVLFTLGAVYILIREFQESWEHPEESEEEDLNHEIEESDDEDKPAK